MSTHRSFTVRVPNDLYFSIADIALADGQNLNAVVNRLLQFGLGKNVDIAEELRRILIRAVEA